MKKVLVIITAVIVASCATRKKDTGARPLFEVLATEEYGGGSIRFFEILDQENEMSMLLRDENLKGKVSPADLKTSTYVLLNMGEKTSGGYSIMVESARELEDRIVLKVKEKGPEPGAMATMALTNPYAIVRVNSKKKIDFE